MTACASTVDPDQMPQNVTSEQGLHYLPLNQQEVKRNCSMFRQIWHKGTSMARTGPRKIVRAMGSSSQRRLIMAPGREANIANSGKSIDLLHNNCMLSVLLRIASKRRFK